MARRIVQTIRALPTRRRRDERRDLLVSVLRALGDGVVLESPFHCDYGWNITIGHDCYINAFCAMLDCAPVSIGSYAQIGPSVMLCAATHPVDGDQRRLGVDTARPITLEENVWIGAGRRSSDRV